MKAYAGLLGLALLAASCHKDSQETTIVAPTAETTPVIAYLTSSTALSGGAVTNMGSAISITASGVCWSASNQNPTISDSKTSDGGKAVFKSALTGLTPNTTYYLRSYVQNDAGTGYGNLVTFKTSTGTADITVNVTTLAGNGSPGLTNGAAINASFNSPQGTAVDAQGNVYVSDSFNHLIRKITPAGIVSTFAGKGTLGFSGGNATTEAQFYSPQGIAVDGSGNVYVADQGNNAIYKITQAGTVTVLAGNGTVGASNGTGSAATFNSPQGIAVDGAGNVYVADRNNNRIRKITSAGVVSTLAGTGANGFTNGDGTTAVFNRPAGVALDATGNLYVTDQNNYAIRKVTSAGVVSTLIGNSITTALLNVPTGIAVDAQNNIYITDQSGRIMLISSQNVLYTLAGKTETSGFLDGSKATALFAGPAGIAVGANKTLYVADYNNHRIRKVVIQ
ncbi:NHL repeat-containing protein [Mucilaginibacter sp. PAMB04274]|uniref:NHL repeat-containing protein n=1 Tax=Mucilaginibacter sp. PAMB04274 TaxID=3138568 RepID=UPI0031F72021